MQPDLLSVFHHQLSLRVCKACRHDQETVCRQIQRHIRNLRSQAEVSTGQAYIRIGKSLPRMSSMIHAQAVWAGCRLGCHITVALEKYSFRVGMTRFSMASLKEVHFPGKVLSGTPPAWRISVLPVREILFATTGAGTRHQLLLRCVRPFSPMDHRPAQHSVTEKA